ncbi:MAG TPA: hypothetical protein VFL94_04470, partial [Actinomycetales bacterium]|nr:hypothetical protein [Actinomycetales bacterium]
MTGSTGGPGGADGRTRSGGPSGPGSATAAKQLDASLRPRLRPGLPQVWRDASTLQVGLSRASGAVVSGLQAGDDLVVAALDGTRTVHQLRAWASEQGILPERVDLIVSLLRDADLLVRQRSGDRPADRVDLLTVAPATRDRLEPDVHAWAVAYPGAGDGVRLLTERSRRHVRVEGDGRVAVAVATTLASAGVGVVTCASSSAVLPSDVLPAGAALADVGTSTGAAAQQAVRRVRDAGTATTRKRTAARRRSVRPDLTVLVADDVLDSRRGDDLVRHDAPHLAVVASLERVVVGPLVLPGRTPCL